MDVNQANAEATLREMKTEMMARLEAMIQNNKEGMEANHEKIDAKIDTNQEKMEARIEANNEKFEVF